MQERRRGCAGALLALGAATVLACCTFTTPGFAKEAAKAEQSAKDVPKDEPPADADAPLPPGDEKRPEPGYTEQRDGGVGAAALWVPRVLLFPLYALTEYGLSRPAGALFTWAERNHIRQRYFEFFTFDDEHKIGLFPTGTIDLGLRATVGAYFVWDDAVGDSDIKVRVTTGGLDLWTVNTLFHAPIDRRSYLRFNADYARRPDSTFYGFGRDIREEGGHYLAEHALGRVSYTEQRQQLLLSASTGVVAARFDPGPDGVPDEALADAIASGRIEAPPALEDGLLALFTGVSARIDTRPPRRPPHDKLRDLVHVDRSGGTIGLYATQFTGLRTTRATPMDEARTPHWLRYGAALAYSLDVTGTQRTLQLETVYAAVEPLPTDNPVPFTQQISLGGSYPLRAFTGGRLVDESAIVTTLSYNWPLLTNLDGALSYSVGNVFARHLRDFDVGHFRSSYGVGVETVSSLDHPFEILLAFGTKPFDEGGGLDTVRFVLGTSASF
jgi:hypothetical protein